MLLVNLYSSFQHKLTLSPFQPIKTKSEISGLLDFIAWLEEVRGDAKDGVILVFHEALNSCPALLLHCLGMHSQFDIVSLSVISGIFSPGGLIILCAFAGRYPHANLLDRFKKVVAGFANGFAIAQDKCIKTMSNFSLRAVSTTLLNKEECLESAADRARLTYQVILCLYCPLFLLSSLLEVCVSWE